MSTVVAKYMPERLKKTVYKFGIDDFIYFFPEKIGLWESAFIYRTDKVDEDAAEEVFDLTNDSGRQEERELYCGKRRSMSVYDIAEVDGISYICVNYGWKKLEL